MGSTGSGSMDGRSCVVTGAAGGMGRAIVQALVDAGASVTASDLSASRLDELAAGVAAPDRLTTVVGDVSVADDVESLVGRAVERFGGLDAAVNAAAIEFEQVPIAQCEDDDYERMMAVNARSVFLCLKHEIRAMVATGRGGSIVNIASTNSFRPQPNQPAYTASKHAVLGLTRSAALDYASAGIRVNVVFPGSIDTPMLRGAMERRGRDPDETARRLSILGRFGTPEEIASAVLFLVSDASSYTTGTTLGVDGGMLFH